MLALASVGLGGGALAWTASSPAAAQSSRHSPAAGMGTLCPGRPRRTSHPSQHRRSRRVAGRRRWFDQQHGGVQPVQLAAHDRSHRSPHSRCGHFQQLPGLLHLGRRMFSDRGHALPTEYVGDHSSAPRRERDTGVRVSGRRRPERLVRGVPGWSAVLRQRSAQRHGQPARLVARLVRAQRLRQRHIGPAGISEVDHGGLDRPERGGDPRSRARGGGLQRGYCPQSVGRGLPPPCRNLPSANT